MDLQNIFNSLNLTTPSWDLLVLFVFLVGLFLYVFKLGRDRAFIMLLSTYVSLAIIDKIDIIKGVVGLDFEINSDSLLICFPLFVLLIYWVILKSPLTSVFNRGPAGSWFDTLIIGFLQIGLFFSITVTFLSPEKAEETSLFIRTFFIDNNASFFWLVVPFLAIAFIKGR